MKLNFIKANPTENMTIFILDPLPRSSYSDVANKLMNYNSLCAEQVGFFEKSTITGSCARLHMMGGEFCGNASRAFAAFMVQKKYATFQREGDEHTVPFEVSGNDGILTAKVKELTEHTFDVKIKLPLHKSAKTFETHYNGVHFSGQLVDFEGISHAVLFTGNDTADEGLLLHIVKELSPLKSGAFGVMFYDKEKNFMTPLVYVEDTQSVVWERSCGTGTAALGIAMSLTDQGSINMVVGQPGGSLEILTTWKDGHIEELYLKGEVGIVAEGEVYLI
jgi:diaminopimelate epimerase